LKIVEYVRQFANPHVKSRSGPPWQRPSTRFSLHYKERTWAADPQEQSALWLTPSIAMNQTEVWITEDVVVDAVRQPLANNGWDLLSTSKTTQQGIDLPARKQGVTLACEAKGGGSSKPGTRRFGFPFPQNQKRSHVAVAVLTALGEVSRGRNKAAIAVPNDSGHLRLISEILPALRRLEIAVYLVGKDKSVTIA